jgi:SAM-dependent methyltransferase
MSSTLDQRIRKYFKHINLYREDIREVVDNFRINFNRMRICDFGCGSGFTTFALALEIDKSVCTGLDLFPDDTQYSFDEILEIENRIKDDCIKKTSDPIRLKDFVKNELCKLVDENCYPAFIKGNILTGKNIPKNIDLAFCQKIFINIHEGKHVNECLGSDCVIKSMKNIARSLSSKGHLLSIEFTGFKLNPFLEESGLEIIKSFDFTRNDIRSRGRTEVISNYTAALCQKIKES